jgi:glycosyltransferase involved in cell wall biosynthesis
MMMADKTLPKVSVIIPVYNGTNYLHEAIDSVLSQTYPNHEVIVVDDGSTDETWTVIQSYGSHVRGIRKENGGVASALNCGVRESTGDYIAWLSHDDLFLANKLERQVEFLRRFPEFKACYTDYYVIDEDGKILREVETPWYPRFEAMRALFGRVYLNGSTMLIERSCFEKVGLFSERLRYTQDIEMWLRFLRHFEIGRVPEKLGKQRVHFVQGSRNLESHTTETQEMFKRMFENLLTDRIFPEFSTFGDEPKVKARAYTWLGDTMAFQRAWYAFAREQYRRAISLDPSWQNPARMKIILNPMWSFLRFGYRRLRSLLGGARGT